MRPFLWKHSANGTADRARAVRAHIPRTARQTGLVLYGRTSKIVVRARNVFAEWPDRLGVFFGFRVSCCALSRAQISGEKMGFLTWFLARRNGVICLAANRAEIYVRKQRYVPNGEMVEFPSEAR